MSDHTPEPWIQLGREINGGDDIVIAGDIWGEKPGESDANARRIVACVNACKGISTEVLEVLSKEIDIVKSQRDRHSRDAEIAEAVEALEREHAHVVHTMEYPTKCGTCKLIAKLKGVAG